MKKTYIKGKTGKGGKPLWAYWQGGVLVTNARTIKGKDGISRLDIPWKETTAPIITTWKTHK